MQIKQRSSLSIISLRYKKEIATKLCYQNSCKDRMRSDTQSYTHSEFS